MILFLDITVDFFFLINWQLSSDAATECGIVQPRVGAGRKLCRRQGFLSLNALDICGWITLCCGGVLCSVRCVAASPGSAH